MSKTSDTICNGILVYNIGAAWFLPTFFITHCIESVISETKRRDLWVLVVSVFGFLISRVVHLPLHLETAMICTIFMNLGVLVQENEKKGNSIFKSYSIISFVIFILCIFRNLKTASWMDYASSTFQIFFYR